MVLRAVHWKQAQVIHFALPLMVISRITTAVSAHSLPFVLSADRRETVRHTHVDRRKIEPKKIGKNY